MNKNEILHVDKQLRDWRDWEKMLKQWMCLVRKSYSDTDGKITPYSYRERTNLGFLASAALVSGWIAIEEYPAEKKGQNGTRKKGRPDLLLWRNGLQYSVEAKLTADTANNFCKKNKISVRHKAAKDDAEKMPNGKKIKQVAITFVIPTFDISDIPQTDKIKVVNSDIKRVLECCNGEKPTFIASVFPGKSPRRTTHRHDRNKSAFGIILLGSLV